MNIKVLRVFIFTITFLYLVNFVTADFSYSLGDDTLRLCRCSELQDVVKIKNNGVETTQYAVSSNLNFVSVTPSDFSLSPNQVQEVKLLVSAPCKSFSKNLEIRVRSDKGDDRILTKQIVAGQCQNLKTNLFVDKNDINPCEQLDYGLLIRNLGNFIETYSVSSSHDAFLNYSNSSVEIQPGELKRVDMVLNLPCSVYGEVPVTFLVVAENNDLQTSITHDLLVYQDYGYELEVDEENLVCEEEENSITINIENNADTPNIYYFDLVGAPKWATLVSENISLEAKGEARLEINLDLIEGGNLGFYDFILTSRTEFGDQFSNKNISLNVSNCYDLSLDILSSEREFCSGEIEFPVRVKNNGLFKETVVLSVEPDFVSKDLSRTSLDSGEELETSIRFTSEDVDASYVFTVTATLPEVNVSVFDSRAFTVLSQGTCHYVDLESDKYSMVRDLENSAIIKLTNKGKTEEEYSLSISPDSFISLSQDTVVLAPSETKEITILSNHSPDTELGFYDFAITVELNGLEYVHGFTINLADKPAYLKLYEYFAPRPCQFATAILAITLFALFLVSISVKKSRGKIRTKQFSMVLFVLLLILVGSVLLIYYYKGPPFLNDPLPESSPLHYFWAWNSDLVLDLNSFVSDPDIGDEVNLSFLREQKRISLSVVDGRIIITPEQDWFGIKKVIMLATDGKGGSSESPVITFEVVKRNKFTLLESYERLCWYINWILLLFSFIFLLVIVSKKLRGRNKVEKKKSGERKKKRK